MSTESFDRNFVVKDVVGSNNLLYDLGDVSVKIVSDEGSVIQNNKHSVHMYTVECNECGTHNLVRKYVVDNLIFKDAPYRCIACANKSKPSIIKTDKFYIGNKLHKLTIIDIIDDILEVQCECGMKTHINKRKFGTTKSCGCLKYKLRFEERYENDDTEIYNRQWSTYKYNANDRGLEFNISKDYAYGVYVSQNGLCALTGIPIEFKSKHSTASMDRIDSSKGYIEGNIQWVHVDINKIKMDLDSTYFQYLCSKVADNFMSLSFDDVLIRPQPSNVNSRKDVNVIKEFNIRGNILKTTGVIVANMDTTGTFAMAKILAQYDSIVALHKFYTFDDYMNEKDFLENNKDNYFISIGESFSDLELLEKINNEITEVKMICIDVANGYRIKYLGFIRKVRKRFPNAIIMAGNIATGAGVYNLSKAGVDIAKIQIGPGHVCSTRIQTGIGNGTLSTILECSKMAKNQNMLIVSDGGIRHPGDVSKSFCSGADFVMIGGMFAGTGEAGGDLKEYMVGTDNYIWDNGKFVEEIVPKKVKAFYGMSSEKAQDIHNGGMNDYRASEGVVSEVDYVGSASNVIQEILGGIRSTCTYIGCINTQDMNGATTFIRVNQVHDKNI